MDNATLQDVIQAATQAAEQAVQGAGQQLAAQVEQQIADSVSAAIQKFMQTSGTATVSSRVENADIGGSESHERSLADETGMLFINAKRTYDEYQHESLESIKRNRAIVDKLISDAQQYDNQRQNIANQALQNAVETANMVGKQAVRHSDIAIDRQWNVDEQGYTAENILRDSTFKEAIAGAVATAVAEALNRAKA